MDQGDVVTHLTIIRDVIQTEEVRYVHLGLHLEEVLVQLHQEVHQEVRQEVRQGLHQEVHQEVRQGLHQEVHLDQHLEARRGQHHEQQLQEEVLRDQHLVQAQEVLLVEEVVEPKLNNTEKIALLRD